MTPSTNRANVAVYSLEKKITAACLTVMGTVVFLDVMHRFWTRQTGLFSRLYGTTPLGSALSMITGGLILLAFVYGALRTRGRPHGAGTFGRAVGLLALAFAAIEAFVRILPNGIVWSQTLGLALMLWVACLGASMAAFEHRHLALDLGSKLWPKRMLPYAQAFGHLLTAVFCVVLGALSLYSIRGHYDDYANDSGGVFVALPVPKWIAFAAMPFGFFVMAVRFAAQIPHSLKGEIEEDDPLQMLGITKDGEK